MSVHIHEVLDYLDTHPVRCHEGNVTSLLKMLHDVYVMHNTQVPFPDDGITMTSEELAFSQGIIIGMHLMSEINTLP